MHKGASALGTQCALNVHSIHIDRVRTRNVKESNRIECALSQSTSVCGSNPVRSGLEWNVGGRSLHNMTSVHRHSRMMSIREDEGFVGYTGGDADVKTQLDEIIRNKGICQKVANAVVERGYSGSADAIEADWKWIQTGSVNSH